jgi:hypothetical protein
MCSSAISLLPTACKETKQHLANCLGNLSLWKTLNALSSVGTPESATLGLRPGKKKQTECCDHGCCHLQPEHPEIASEYHCGNEQKVVEWCIIMYLRRSGFAFLLALESSCNQSYAHLEGYIMLLACQRPCMFQWWFPSFNVKYAIYDKSNSGFYVSACTRTPLFMCITMLTEKKKGGEGFGTYLASVWWVYNRAKN